MISENRVYDLKYLCTKKWRAENPDGYIGQARHTSVRGAASMFCTHAGFASLEEADDYFRHQDEVARAKMIEVAKVAEARQPAWTPEQQEYVRAQLQSGLEGAEVSRDVPQRNVITTGMIIVIGAVLAVLYMLLGRK